MFDLGPGWTPGNRAALTKILQHYGTGGPEYDPARPPVAAFDWDDTVIEHDIGDALFFYQVDRLAFRFDIPGFWDLIPDDLRARWHSAVRPLSGLMNGAPPFAVSESVHAHPAYPAYRHLGYQLYRAMLVAPRDVGYPWFTQVLLGLTVAQARALSRAALDEGLAVPLSEQIIHGPDGSLPVRVRSGLRYRPAMRALMAALRACGFQVWIVSATNRWSIEVAAGELGIPAGRVVGMTTAVRDGRITAELVEPAPYFVGKATALESVLGPNPRVVLAAGDSPSDEGLLSLAEAARIVVTPSSRELVTRAESGLALGEPWLLQASFGQPLGER